LRKGLPFPTASLLLDLLEMTIPTLNLDAFVNSILRERDRAAIARLWRRKLDQDAQGLPQAERDRNLEPASAEFLSVLAAGVSARTCVEIGGSTGISTIALAAAARSTGGRLTSIEIVPERQAESRETLRSLGLDEIVDYVCADAATVLPQFTGLDFVLIDCEKEDYIRFLDMLQLAPGAIIVADNIVSHAMKDYVAHVRERPGVESISLPIGKGLEVTRFVR
jgi:predicted O-methyltransferase YrrM